MLFRRAYNAISIHFSLDLVPLCIMVVDLCCEMEGVAN